MKKLRAVTVSGLLLVGLAMFLVVGCDSGNDVQYYHSQGYMDRNPYSASYYFREPSQVYPEPYYQPFYYYRTVPRPGHYFERQDDNRPYWRDRGHVLGASDDNVQWRHRHEQE